MVQILLSDDRIDSAGGNLAIAAASMYGQRLVIELLLSDPRVEPREGLYAASLMGYTEIYDMLQQEVTLRGLNQ